MLSNLLEMRKVTGEKDNIYVNRIDLIQTEAIKIEAFEYFDSIMFIKLRN